MTVWLLGLFSDLLACDIVGVHAIIFVTVFFILRRFQKRISSFPLWQLVFVMGALLFFSAVMQYFLYLLVGASSSFYWVLQSFFVNLLAWVVLYMMTSYFKQQWQPLY